MESLALLRQRGIDFEYHILGEGDDYKRLFFAAHQLNISDCVVFHGKKTQVEINQHLANSDLFIMYSLDEGFCNSVLEAQAMGCLTLVSNNKALMENVLDGETGWVVQGRNPKALAETIEKVLHLSEVELRRIRENAMQRVNQIFNLNNQKQAFIQFYEDK